MRKVKIDFFCIQEKKAYKAGEDYTGKRTDLDHVLEPETKQHPKTKKGATEKKK